MLSKFEQTYLKAGIGLFIIGPFQALLFFMLMLQQDADIVFCHPILSLLAWIVPAYIFQRIVMHSIVKDKDDRQEMSSMLGVTSVFIFSFQAGILMICRIIFVCIVRKIKRDPEFRRDMPFILWLPE